MVGSQVELDIAPTTASRSLLPYHYRLCLARSYTTLAIIVGSKTPPWVEREGREGRK